MYKCIYYVKVFTKMLTTQSWKVST